MAGWTRGKFGAICVILQLIFLALFGVFVKYTKMADARYDIHSKDTDKGGMTAEDSEVTKYYSSTLVADFSSSGVGLHTEQALYLQPDYTYINLRYVMLP